MYCGKWSQENGFSWIEDDTIPLPGIVAESVYTNGRLKVRMANDVFNATEGVNVAPMLQPVEVLEMSR